MNLISYLDRTEIKLEAHVTNVIFLAKHDLNYVKRKKSCRTKF